MLFHSMLWALRPQAKQLEVKIPKVLVLIPDGNRRWAKHLGKTGSYGHDVGLERCREVVTAAFNYGIKHVVFWAASLNNLTDRDKNEVCHLTQLIKQELRRVISETSTNQYRFKMVGSWRKTSLGKDQELIDLADESERATSLWIERHFTILFGYDFRIDMQDAISSVVSTCPNFSLLDDKEQKIAVTKSLSTGFLGDVDFVIRTGTNNDPHWSASFLGWNVANAQLCFLKTPWPMFGAPELQEALADYGTRERRGGA